MPSISTRRRRGDGRRCGGNVGLSCCGGIHLCGCGDVRLRCREGISFGNGEDISLGRGEDISLSGRVGIRLSGCFCSRDCHYVDARGVDGDGSHRSCVTPILCDRADWAGGVGWHDRGDWGNS